ncbi:hypothetical protein F5Y10DRAFT_293852 [Nemania abortiva]|nr:hypothetical protein F5Y10DRAFT_293852 [Nemania abortiva]
MNMSYFSESDDVIEPVQIIDVLLDDEPNKEKLFSESCANLNDLKGALKFPSLRQSHVRFISICQRNSWRPLQITQPMFQFIVDHHDLYDSVHDISSCFFTRNLDLEDIYCAPLSLAQSGDLVDTSYTLRYPELKENENRWALRQSGIYYRFNHKTNQHFLLLLSPLPNSAAHSIIKSQMLKRLRSMSDDPFWVHRLMFSTYTPAWRRYISWLEGRLIPITNLTLIADIDREMRVNYEQLNTLYIVMNKLLQIPTLISHSLDVLDGLLGHSTDDKISNNPRIQQLENFRRQTAAYSRTAACLHQRAQTTAQLLSDTLSLREQTIAKNQTSNMASLSKSTYLITIMGLLYLPTTLVATVFGTNFFNFDGQKSAIVASTDIWYFFVASGVLTVITLFACYCFREYGTMAPRQAFKTIKWKWIMERGGSTQKRDKKSSHVSSV